MEPHASVAAFLFITLAALLQLPWEDPLAQRWTGTAAWAVLTAWSIGASFALTPRHRGPAAAIALGTAAGIGLVQWVGVATLLLALLSTAACAIAGLLVIAGLGRTRSLAARGLTLGAPLLGLACAAFAPTVLRCGEAVSVEGSRPWVSLQALAAEDQQDRRNGCFVLNPTRDVQRRTSVLRILAAHPSPPPQAAADAAIVLLHAFTVAELRLSHQLFRLAAASGHVPAYELEKAALDRLQLALGRPQVHGTQRFHHL
ncbi:hypothetical protein FSC37_18245 [Piscinibacter aquaticus]|uniref:Uncharacterized protein n=1 Tax=Piscinibacter aquaticus TaxID=392597 RepID=A0A5C6U1R9_9BURK|nr:hypothetical protein FSC37_18245 [Piscinibacter aquaticus]